MIETKRGQELPGWAWIVALILGLFAVVFLIWLAVKSGNLSVEQMKPFK